MAHHRPHLVARGAAALRDLIFTTPPRIAFRRPWPGSVRGLVLWLFSLGLLALGGINYIATPLPLATDQALVVLRFSPAWVWGVVMVGVACTTGFCSYCHYGRDRWGFIIYTTFCVGWGCMFIAGFLFFDAPLRAVGSSVIWLLFGGGMAAVSALPNTPLRTADRPGAVVR